MWRKSNKYWEYEVSKMKKRLIRRGLMGFLPGIAIGFVITVIISMCFSDGSYYPVTPRLSSVMGSELNAVLLQTVLCGIMGSGFAMASVIWEIDSWSLAKQSGIYFALICALMLPIAYVANWMEHSIGGVLSYVGIFVATFIFVWISQYLAWRCKIKRMNDSVKKANDTK